MNCSKLNTPNIRIASETILGVTFLIYGCFIYLLFRSKTLYIYQWGHALGLSNTIDKLRKYVESWDVSEFGRFCLPDGLYCAAYILTMDAIWHTDKRSIKYFIILLVPFITISSELFQYFGLVKGTFDLYDLMCYIIPPIIYFLYNQNIPKFNKLKNSIISVPLKWDEFKY